MKNQSLGQVFQPIIGTLRRFNFTLFIVIVVGGLVAAVFILNNILVDSSNPEGHTSTLATANFDQVTVDQLNKLWTSNSNSINLSLPSGRINPFQE